jgi:hypothetical protein
MVQVSSDLAQLNIISFTVFQYSGIACYDMILL